MEVWDEGKIAKGVGVRQSTWGVGRGRKVFFIF